ncbi:2TM domain-containing protein [Sediminibacterium roseum]|uniref:2TM domain-containing protein n=1 Tax=Sediminibacterium roseum TaxID=1978412 RepID=A0ABW9ZS28_9BACT|nr:2TM domain-containing protein [Sediminibacterium roseum]NCI48868.1 2TM domain-containing protein [Sediminibacterium roseum]
MSTNDEILWHIAKKRASFKKQLLSYILVNCFLWGVWFLSDDRYTHLSFGSAPWPVWVMFWWGIGLAFSFAGAYIVNTKESIREEFEKLKKQQH